MKNKFLYTITILILSKSISFCQNNKQYLPYGLQLFTSVTPIKYSIPIPLKEFKKEKITEIGKYSFVNNKNKEVYMELESMGRSDKIKTIEAYFKDYYTEREEEVGKVVLKKELIKSKNCFYAMGYYSNFIDRYNFIEITWLRKKDIVKLFINYDVKDNLLWNNRLKTIVQYNL